MMGVDARAATLLAPLAAVASGVFATRFADFSSSGMLLAGFALAFLSLLALRYASVSVGLWSAGCGFFACGAVLASIEAPVDRQRIDLVAECLNLDLELPVRICGQVVEPPEEFADADRFLLKVESILDGDPDSSGSPSIGTSLIPRCSSNSGSV